jgi:hypothetical protein
MTYGFSGSKKDQCVRKSAGYRLVNPSSLLLQSRVNRLVPLVHTFVKYSFKAHRPLIAFG